MDTCAVLYMIYGEIMNELRFYVYAYIRSKDSTTAKAGTPYYIGKGQGKRAYVKHNNVHTPKNKTFIILIEQNLTEVGALALERRLITWHGKKTSCGILHNKSDGGESTLGMRGYKRSKASIEKQIKSCTGLKRNETTCKNISNSKIGDKNPNYGKKNSAESNRKNSESNKGKHFYWLGKTMTEESNLKRSAALSGANSPLFGVESKLKGRPQEIITCPYCGKSGGIPGMKRYHFDNCKHKDNLPSE